MRLIPVILPGVPKKFLLPTFLREFQYVDFRGEEGFDSCETMRQLVRAILGRS